MKCARKRIRKTALRTFNVFIVFPTSADSKIAKMSGVFRFLSETPPWNLSIVSPDSAPPDFTKADGIIVTGTPSPQMRRAIEQTTIPTVAIALEFNRTLQLTSVTTDGLAIGRAVANEFLRQGVFRGYSFVRTRNSSAFLLNYEKGFGDCIRSAGFDVLSTTEDDLPALLAAPRPTLAIAADDYIAAHTVAFGRSEGLSVPGDLSVLGLLNDTVFCENHAPPLSSVELDFESQGYLAARALQSLMHGKVLKDPIPVGLKSIIRRATTPALSAGDSLVRRGTSFIRQHASEPITVKDVIRHLKVSRRLAEMRFREIANTTILSLLLEERLAVTKRALATSDDRIRDICRHCGWKSENYPKRLFAQRFGMSMSQWQKAHAFDSFTP